ncbi:MAG: VIT1/CCC1 transporter family protein [Caldisericia bacterium]|nr:VIT1/CCC1 transporter family protein [Caldisericia bacterium]
MNNLKEESLKKLLQFQTFEKTESIFYSLLSNRVKGQNRGVLEKISKEEIKHYNIIKKFTKRDTKEKKLFLLINLILSYILGITFSIKLMENGEKRAQENYSNFIKEIDGEEKEIFLKVLDEENQHERELTNLIDEEKVNFIGSMVLGINDALIELTGALAGFTFTLRNTNLIFVVGFITGFAASLSMASSEYLSKRAEKEEGAIKAAIYTGITYILTVILLIYPYLIFKNYIFSFLTTLIMAILIVLITSLFVSVVKEVAFKKRFLEMFILSFGIAVISYLMGYALRVIFNVEV